MSSPTLMSWHNIYLASNKLLIMKTEKESVQGNKKNFRYLLTLVFHVFSDFLAKQIYNHTSSESSFLAGELVLRVVTLVTVAILP